MSPLIIGIGVVLVFGVALILLGLSRSAQPDVIGDRLSQFTERTMTLSSWSFSSRLASVCCSP